MINSQYMKYFGVLILCLCLMFLSGCDNVMTPKDYNKAETLCKNANQSVLYVSTDPMANRESKFYLTVYCTEGVIIRSGVAK